TTGTMAGGSPRKRARRSASNCWRNPAMKSARTSARRLSCPLTSGTWLTTALTRRSIAATTRTGPPEQLLPPIPARRRSTPAQRPAPPRIHLRQGAGVGDGVPVVTDLSPGVDLLPGLAVAGAEAAVVKHHHVQPARGERFSERIKVHLLDRGEPVRHHHGRPRR